MKVVVRLAAALIVIALGVFFFMRFAPPQASPEDAEARRIVDACAIGTSEEARAGLSTGLARRLRQLNGEAVVTSTRVGAILDKIGPDAVGRDNYVTYVRCLREQTELSLTARGVRIEQAGTPTPVPSPVPVATGEGSPQSLVALPKAAGTRSPRATRSGPGAASRARVEPAAGNRTTGDCSPIISGSTIGDYTAHCEEKGE